LKAHKNGLNGFNYHWIFSSLDTLVIKRSLTGIIFNVTSLQLIDQASFKSIELLKSFNQFYTDSTSNKPKFDFLPVYI